MTLGAVKENIITEILIKKQGTQSSTEQKFRPSYDFSVCTKSTWDEGSGKT